MNTSEENRCIFTKIDIAKLLIFILLPVTLPSTTKMREAVKKAVNKATWSLLFGTLKQNEQAEK